MSVESQPLISEHAEVSVIGGLLLRPEKIHTIELPSSDFALPLTRRAYEAICSLVFEQGAPVDTLTVAEEARRRGVADDSFEAVLAEWAAQVPTAENVGHYAEIVRRLSQQRRIVMELSQLRNEAANLDPAQVLTFGNDLQRRLARVCEARATSVALSESAAEVMLDVEADKPPIPRIATGIPGLDQIIGGVPIGSLTVIAARPTLGKSALARRIARNQAAAGHPVGCISIEENQRQFAACMLCTVGIVDTWRFVNARLSAVEKMRLRRAREEIGALPLWVCDDRPLTPEQAVARLGQMKAEHGIEVGIVDYWNRLILPGRHDRTDEAAEVVSRVAAAAEHLGIALIVVAQLNRENEREGRRPCLRDLKECGSWEESAFTVLFVHRPGLYKATEPQDAIEIIVAKQKIGPTGTAHCKWCGKYLWVDDLPPPGCCVAQCNPRECRHQPGHDQSDLWGAGSAR